MHNETENASLCVGCKQCLISLEISQQPHLIALTVTTVVSCAIGLTSAILLAYYLYKRSVYHINIRLLMWNMCVALGLLSMGICYLSLEHLVVFAIYQDDPCKMVIAYNDCHKKRNMALVLPTAVTANGVFSLALERTYATINYRTYDTQPSKLIGLSLIAVQWLVGVLVGPVANLVKGAVNDRDGTMPYCISLLVTPGSATKGMIFSFVLEVASFAFVAKIYSSNRHKQRLQVVASGDKHLSQRYQLAENLKTTRMFIPSIVGHIAVSMSAYVDAYYVAGSGRLDSDADVARLAAYNELMSLLFSFYAPTFCITYQFFSFPVTSNPSRQVLRNGYPRCIVQSPQLLAHVRTQWACLSTPKATAVSEEDGEQRQQNHFEQLEAIWLKKKKEQEPN